MTWNDAQRGDILPRRWTLVRHSLYDYFQSKDHLLAFVSDRVVGPFLKTIDDLVPARVPAPQKLETILRVALE
jgi:AcrR family transcriptional regulator